MTGAGVWWTLVAALVQIHVGAACAEPNFAVDEDPTPPPRSSLDAAAAPRVIDGSPPPDRAAPVDAGAVDDAPRTLRVFVSSVASLGNFGGLAGADALCTNLATTAGLGGAWTAWLSVSLQAGPHAIDRLTSAGPWYLVSGELVAATKAELLAGPLRHAIDRDEKRAAVSPSRVWTGTGPDGRFLTNECNNWTGSAGGNVGRFGDTSATNATWTSGGTELCVESRRVYCFER